MVQATGKLGVSKKNWVRLGTANKGSIQFSTVRAYMEIRWKNWNPRVPHFKVTQ